MAKDEKSSTPNKAGSIHVATYEEVQKMHPLYFNIVKRRYIWFALSLLLLVPGLISLFVQGLNLGIDFRGGSMLEMKFTQSVTQEAVSKTLESVGLSGSVQLSNDDTVALIRTEALEEADRDKLLQALEEKVATIDKGSFSEDKVGPAMGDELKRNAIIALSIACVLMIGYISVRFKFIYAISGILAQLHDVLIVLGIFSLFQIEIDSTFVAAILTVFGYSINDTIVIFDRIRENEGRMKKNDSFENMVDQSIWQVMRRSILTAMTVLIALVSIYVFGGESTRIFSLAMIFGVLIGAYSSIFNASQLVVEIKKHTKPKGGRKTAKA